MLKGVEGFHFRTTEELAERTRAVISDPVLLSSLSQAAERGAARYSEEAMAVRLDRVLDRVRSAR